MVVELFITVDLAFPYVNSIDINPWNIMIGVSSENLSAAAFLYRALPRGNCSNIKLSELQVKISDFGHCDNLTL